MGAKPPPDGKASTWVQQTISSPTPVAITLEQLDNLLSKFPFLSQETKVKANLQRALAEYCEHLMNNSEVTSCTAPGEDPPLPTVKFPVNDMKVFAQTLTTIKPKQDNTLEWSEIRWTSSVIGDTVTETNFPEKMQEFLSLFTRIQSWTRNMDEWGAIQTKCNDLLGSPTLDQFYGVVKQFSDTIPKSSNTHEWSSIRSACNDILTRKP